MIYPTYIYELQQDAWLSLNCSWHSSKQDKMDVGEKRKTISAVTKHFDRFFSCENLEETLINFRETIEAASIDYGDPFLFYPRLKVCVHILYGATGWVDLDLGSSPSPGW